VNLENVMCDLMVSMQQKHTLLITSQFMTLFL